MERARELEQIERGKAKERQGTRTDIENNITQDFAGSEKGESSAKVAEQTGFGKNLTKGSKILPTLI